MQETGYTFSKREVVFIIIIVLLLVACGFYVWRLVDRDKAVSSSIDSFAACVAAGNPVMDSSPEQCSTGDKTFVNITTFEECKQAGNPVQESYPERCSANGQTYTNPEQEAVVQGVEDRAAIVRSLVNYCTANGATDTALVEQQLGQNIQDTTLFVIKDGFARLSATCGEGGFRAFLVKTEDEETTWKFIVGTQEETAACTTLDGYGFPVEVVSQCYDENGQLRAIAPAG